MPPDTLASIQALLGEVFRAPEPNAGPRAEMIAGAIRPSATLSPLARAEIYREQFWCRHLESLAEDLPALALFLGDEAFDRFLRAYLVACPPRSWTLRHLGDRLIIFSEGYEGFSPDRAEAAREIIHFELACFDAFDAYDVAPIEALPTAAPERWVEARLSFLRTLTLASYAHPVNELRAAVKRGRTTSDLPALPRRRTHVAVWRAPHTLEVKHRALLDGEHALLQALVAGATVGMACLGAKDHASSLGGWFAGWARRGWITAVDVPPT
jgi:hypothetical protein